MHKFLNFLIPVIALTTACSDSNNSTFTESPFADFVSATYSDNTTWLCHPQLADADNVCKSNLDTTVVFADGSTEIERHIYADDPSVDCFYVYPTVSADEAGNSDLASQCRRDFYCAKSGCALLKLLPNVCPCIPTGYCQCDYFG